MSTKSVLTNVDLDCTVSGAFSMVHLAVLVFDHQEYEYLLIILYCLVAASTASVFAPPPWQNLDLLCVLLDVYLNQHGHF